MIKFFHKSILYFASYGCTCHKSELIALLMKKTCPKTITLNSRLENGRAYTDECVLAYA